MKKYIVTMKEVHNQEMLIEANSPEEALSKVSEGEGTAQSEAYYSYTLDSDEFEVTERKV